MRFIFLSLTLISLLTACQPKQNQSTLNLPAGVQMIVAEEVLQATQYTYIRGTQNEKEVWLALPLMADAKTGTTYYYDHPMEMTNFQSKDLNRTFASIFFINGVRTTPESVTTEVKKDTTHAGKVNVEKKEVKVEPLAGGLTLARLYSSKSEYSGKTVKIKGEVTKFNAAIMDKNWIHIQDGTEFQGKFDLTATTNQEVKVGDIITLEGKIVLDQDFGYGYKYELLMEDAKIIKK